MRKIKFRGKRIDNGSWVFGYLIGNDVIVGNIVDWNEEYFNTEYWRKVDPNTVGQYTGVKDRNRTDIYEGDIIRHSLDWVNAGVVIFLDGGFGTEHYHLEDVGICEVISNIHSEEARNNVNTPSSHE